MTSKRIFVTGASGCIGHYVVEALIQETNHELFLLVRNPDKLKFDYHVRPGVTILQGDMREIDKFSDLLKTIDCAVLIATAWGGAQEVYDVNVVKTLRLLNLLDPTVCQQAIYFATASILDRNNEPLKEAETIGTDYIRSKYACFQQLGKLKMASRITTLFPTLLLGGDAHQPQSHVSSGVVQVANWAGLLRFLKADGSFHYIHGKDIAQIVRHLIDHPPAKGERRQLVLGNQKMTVNQAIEETCLYLNKRIYFRIPLTPGLANLLIAVFRIKMAAWDRFSMNYRHFTHRYVVSPATFGLPTYCATFADVLKISGVEQRR
jgi:nucleoside-diphosphate-sugar epimerase